MVSVAPPVPRCTHNPEADSCMTGNNNSAPNVLQTNQNLSNREQPDSDRTHSSATSRSATTYCPEQQNTNDTARITEIDPALPSEMCSDLMNRIQNWAAGREPVIVWLQARNNQYLDYPSITAKLPLLP